jgi:hypothetical protein
MVGYAGSGKVFLIGKRNLLRKDVVLLLCGEVVVRGSLLCKQVIVVEVVVEVVVTRGSCEGCCCGGCCCGGCCCEGCCCASSCASRLLCGEFVVVRGTRVVVHFLSLLSHLHH